MMRQYKDRLRKYKFYFLAIGLPAALITLLILPADYFDYGPPMCLSVVLANVECYGCGMTRAVQHLLHFDFEAAAQYNKLSFIALPLVVIMCVNELVSSYKSLKANSNARQ
jgi:hypothetical protein